MSTSDWLGYLPLLLLVLVFWFLILRPMRKRQQQFAATQQAVAAGTRVMLASGIFGDVVSVNDETVELKIAPETTVTVARQAISRVIAPEATEGN